MQQHDPRNNILKRHLKDGSALIYLTEVSPLYSAAGLSCLNAFTVNFQRFRVYLGKASVPGQTFSALAPAIY